MKHPTPGSQPMRVHHGRVYCRGVSHPPVEWRWRQTLGKGTGFPWEGSQAGMSPVQGHVGSWAEPGERLQSPKTQPLERPRLRTCYQIDESVVHKLVRVRAGTPTSHHLGLHTK